MVIDTPIVDTDMRMQIANAYSIADRLSRARIFCDYLDSQWELLVGQHLPFEWPTIRALVSRDIEYITGRISIDEKVIQSSDQT